MTETITKYGITLLTQGRHQTDIGLVPAVEYEGRRLALELSHTRFKLVVQAHVTTE